MVDYTKMPMRDESWRRWKGGAKLAADLAAFYTAKRVTDRMALQNPGFSANPAPNGQLGDKRAAYRKQKLDELVGFSSGRGSGNRRNIQRAFAVKASAPEDPVPGLTAPKR